MKPHAAESSAKAWPSTACDVAVVTNLGEGDHLGLNDIHTLEDLAKVKRCIVDVVPPDGTAVLNANDPLVVGMEPYCAGKICYFALDENHPVIVRHRNAGGQVIFVRDNTVIVAEGTVEEPWISLDRVPLTRGGQVAFHVENTLAVLAAAIAMRVPRDVIVSRAESFGGRHGEGSGPVQRAGHPRRHGCGRLRPQRRRTGRLDPSHGEVPAPAADLCLYHGRRPPRLRHGSTGRPVGRGLRPRYPVRGPLSPRPSGGRDHPADSAGASSRASAVKQIDEIRGANAAVELALRSAQPQDLMLVQADTVDETLQFIREYLESISPEPGGDEETVPIARESAGHDRQSRGRPGPEHRQGLTPASGHRTACYESSSFNEARTAAMTRGTAPATSSESSRPGATRRG